MYCKYNCVCTAAAAAKLLQSCLTQRPHGLQPTRLHHPWDSPGKRTGVGAIAVSGVCTQETRHLCDLLSHGSCFPEVIWNQTCSISEVCLNFLFYRRTNWDITFM